MQKSFHKSGIVFAYKRVIDQFTGDEMLAIPLDTEHSTTLSKLYGKAPFFALLDTEIGSFKVVENEVVGKGPKSAGFLKEHGATGTIFYHMGEGVYKSFEENCMDVYSADYSKDTIETIFQNMKKDGYKKLDSSNYNDLLDPGEGESCKCGCNN
jgi:predicted Fe-Mo cluster-binding NifX family protein